MKSFPKTNFRDSDLISLVCILRNCLGWYKEIACIGGFKTIEIKKKKVIGAGKSKIMAPVDSVLMQIYF